MEQEKETWQAFIEDSGYNVEVVQTCRVLNKVQMRTVVRLLLAQVKNPDRLKLTRQIEAAFRSELGAKDNNALIRELIGGEKLPRKIFVNTTDEALLFPELYKAYKKEIDEAVGVSSESKKDAQYYLKRFYEAWEGGRQIAPEPQQLPDELNTERAKEAFVKAIGRGWIVKRQGGFEWQGIDGKKSKAQLAYLCAKVYNYRYREREGNVGDNVHYEALERLFNVSRIDRAMQQVFEAKKPQLWRHKIDALFNQ